MARTDCSSAPDNSAAPVPAPEPAYSAERHSRPCQCTPNRLLLDCCGHLRGSPRTESVAGQTAAEEAAARKKRPEERAQKAGEATAVANASAAAPPSGETPSQAAAPCCAYFPQAALFSAGRAASSQTLAPQTRPGEPPRRRRHIRRYSWGCPPPSWEDQAWWWARRRRCRQKDYLAEDASLRSASRPSCAAVATARRTEFAPSIHARRVQQRLSLPPPACGNVKNNRVGEGREGGSGRI